MNDLINDVPELNINDIKEALKNTNVYLFRYFPKEKLLVNNKEICEALTCDKYMYNMPLSFCNEYIYEADKNIFLELYDKIQNNEPYATNEFRLKNGFDRCRITLTTTVWDESHNAQMCTGIF